MIFKQIMQCPQCNSVYLITEWAHGFPNFCHACQRDGRHIFLDAYKNMSEEQEASLCMVLGMAVGVKFKYAEPAEIGRYISDVFKNNPEIKPKEDGGNEE